MVTSRCDKEDDLVRDGVKDRRDDGALSVVSFSFVGQFEFGSAGTVAGVPSWASTTFLWTCKLARLAEKVMEAL